MSKPSLASRITDAVKRVFSKSTDPADPSTPQDTAAGDAAVKDRAANETIPADTFAQDSPGEFATEAASAQSQRPSAAVPAPEPIVSAPAATPAEPVEVTEPVEPATAHADLVKPEEQDEIVQTLNVAEAETVAASTEVFTDVRPADASGHTASGQLPVPNYDALTLPSVRARLRKLTIEQVRELRAYETANANRDEFVRMYDNRVAKLEADAAS